MKPVNADKLLNEKGGKWLGYLRNWIKWEAYNGDIVTWNSDEYLQLKPLTVKQMERLASYIAAEAINEERSRFTDHDVAFLKTLLNEMQKDNNVDFEKTFRLQQLIYKFERN